MKPTELIEKIYFGDSGCKSIIIDCWGGTIKIQLDCFFLLSGKCFDYKKDKEFFDGFIVFDGVEEFSFSSGKIPNDTLNNLTCCDLSSDEVEKYKFTLSIDSVDMNAESSEVLLHIIATSMFTEENGN
jgi:hypothetical protein